MPDTRDIGTPFTEGKHSTFKFVNVMSNTEGQARRIVGPVSLAEILGRSPTSPVIETSLEQPSDDKPPIYTRADILAESVGRGVSPSFCSLGTNVTVRRRFA